MPFNLIVTDMHYPLAVGMEADYDAPGILVTVWYNPLCDLNREFGEILRKLADK